MFPSRAGYRSARPTFSKSSFLACNARPVHTVGPGTDIFHPRRTKETPVLSFAESALFPNLPRAAEVVGRLSAHACFFRGDVVDRPAAADAESNRLQASVHLGVDRVPHRGLNVRPH